MEMFRVLASFFSESYRFKTSWGNENYTNAENYIVAIKAPFNISKMVNAHFNI